MVMSKVPKARMTIMTDPGGGAGAGVGHYGAIMATMMGNLSHDWPRSRQEPPNVPNRAALTLSYLHYPGRLLFTKIGYYSPKEATMYQRRHLMYQSRLLRHFVSTVAHFGRSRQASIHQNSLQCTKGAPTNVPKRGLL